MTDFIDMARANRMIDFIETLRVPEGMHQGQQLIMRPWQRDIITPVYAPVDEHGIRIVRKAIYSIGKKNGKTPLLAGLTLGHLVGPEAKRNEQIYSAAFERDQAALTFRYMTQMIEMDEELSDLTIIRTTKKEIESRPNGSIYKALSSEARSKHGISPAVLIFDELAQFGADREFYDTLIQGRGAHKEPLLWIISTQAADDLAVLSQEIDYALAHGHEDPTVKLFFFHTPENDPDNPKKDIDLMDREAWKLSNPALGDFLSEADMLEAARTAKNMPSSEPGFRNLRLNQRISATARFMSIGTWKANGKIQNNDALFKGRITAGLDLSGKNDLSSLILDAYYKKEHNIFSYFWTPLDNIKERGKRDRVPYNLWVDQGFLEGKPGKTIDYEYIAQKVDELHGLYSIDELRFDRWRIEDFQRALNKIGCENHIVGKEEPESSTSLCLVPHGQGFKDMNPSIETVDDIFTESRANHNNHPVLTMCAANAVVELDPAGNRKFAKHKSTGRIDGMVAMAMAVNGAELPDIEEDRIQPMPIFI
jgi:phage terminase large subunit-like protein